MIRILVAEDNAVNRELLRELLEARGYAVSEACNGQEALQMIEKTEPELLLMDIGMPVLDGFWVIRRIRENPKFGVTPGSGSDRINSSHSLDTRVFLGASPAVWDARKRQMFCGGCLLTSD